MNYRLYTVRFSGVSVSAVQDLWEIVNAAGKPSEIIGIDLSQTSDFGDGQDEVLRVSLKSGQTSAGSGGTSSITPNPSNPSGAAAGFTAARNNTTQASGGTIITHWDTGWNVRGAGPVMLPDEFRFHMTGGRRYTLEISAPADAITMNCTLWIREYG